MKFKKDPEKSNLETLIKLLFHRAPWLEKCIVSKMKSLNLSWIDQCGCDDDDDACGLSGVASHFIVDLFCSVYC